MLVVHNRVLLTGSSDSGGSRWAILVWGWQLVRPEQTELLWGRDRAEKLNNQLENADSNVGALTYQLNAVMTLIKEMREEILESNLDSPNMQCDLTKAWAAELAIMAAHNDGYEIDLEKDRGRPIR